MMRTAGHGGRLRQAPRQRVVKPGRDYFKHLRDVPHPGMVVSRPFFDQRTGKWVVAYARRLDLPDGRFGGVVEATIAVDFMTELLARPHLGPRGMAMLRYADAGLISVHPPLAGALNEIGNTEISDELRSLLATGVTSGSYHSPRMRDGVERINSVRRVEGLPFLLVVGVASENYLVAWRRDVEYTGALLVVVLLLSIGAALLMRRYHRRQHAHSARLREALADLRDRDQALGITERVGGAGCLLH
jgi:hypothetical protein